jgi:hypothetical protein
VESTRKSPLRHDRRSLEDRWRPEKMRRPDLRRSPKMGRLPASRHRREGKQMVGSSRVSLLER